MEDFLKIVVTLPEFIDNEGKIIEGLLEGFADYVHIRKPGCSQDQLEILINDISPIYRKRLKLHDHFSLAEKYKLGGVQLNSRNPVCDFKNLKLSCSCHSIADIECNYKDMEYVTLSPIYDSISKGGYQSKFDINKIKRNITNKNVIAMGGVTPEKFPELKNAGFKGAAMLGVIWNNIDKFISRL